MTSPPQDITIRCPACHREFRSWWRPSINLKMDHFDEKYMEEATVKTCPHCGQKVKLDTLIVDEDGVWHWGEPGGQR
jgi:endogenous inhibitor of DNA gyrase (YacG/DUF329 family)